MAEAQKNTSNIRLTDITGEGWKCNVFMTLPEDQREHIE